MSESQNDNTKKYYERYQDIQNKQNPFSENPDDGEQTYPSVVGNHKAEAITKAISINPDDKKSLGFFGGRRMDKIRQQKLEEGVESVLTADLERLQHELDKVTSQSKEKNRSESAQYVELLRTHFQENMYQLENARQENRNSAITKAYEIAHEGLVAIENKNIDETAKYDLAKIVLATRDRSVARIEADSLANKYEMGSGD